LPENDFIFFEGNHSAILHLSISQTKQNAQN